MAKIKQHRTNHFTFADFEDVIVEFETVDELLNIDFVKNFSMIDGFYRYSIHQNFSFTVDEFNSFKLMAEYADGYEWFVIGHLIDLDFALNLPIWKAKYKKEE